MNTTDRRDTRIYRAIFLVLPSRQFEGKGMVSNSIDATYGEVAPLRGSRSALSNHPLSTVPATVPRLWLRLAARAEAPFDLAPPLRLAKPYPARFHLCYACDRPFLWAPGADVAKSTLEFPVPYGPDHIEIAFRGPELNTLLAAST